MNQSVTYILHVHVDKCYNYYEHCSRRDQCVPVVFALVSGTILYWFGPPFQCENAVLLGMNPWVLTLTNELVQNGSEYVVQ